MDNPNLSGLFGPRRMRRRRTGHRTAWGFPPVGGKPICPLSAPPQRAVSISAAVFQRGGRMSDESRNPVRGKRRLLPSAPNVVSSVFEPKAKALAEKAVELAQAGDVAAMRLVFDRIAPAPKDRSVRVELPKVESAADLPGVVCALLSAAASGEISPSEAAQLAGLAEQYRKQAETADLAARIAALEEAANARKP